MTWQVFVRMGPEDDSVLPLRGDVPRLELALERPGDPFAIGEDFLRVCADSSIAAPDRAVDLVNLAMTVYSADLSINRELSPDGWTREMGLHVPVRDLDVWIEETQNHVVHTLRFLTGDEWALGLRARSESAKAPGSKRLPINAACLFSGGLDSLVGAINLLEEGRRVALVAHHGAGTSGKFQKLVLALLESAYPGRIEPVFFYVQPRKRGAAGELTMRSRSFLFLSLGVAVAAAAESAVPLVVSENGLISLNVPLTVPRMGSAATRTTHPYFVNCYQQLVDRLGLSVVIEMPARFQTKGEMLRSVRNPKVLADCLAFTMSCARPDDARYRGRRPGTHCGYCTPCIIRRAALEAAELPQDAYVNDMRSPKSRLPKGRARNADLRAFQMALARDKGATSARQLFNVLSTGPLPPDDVAHHAAVYERGMNEVRQFLEAAKVA